MISDPHRTPAAHQTLLPLMNECGVIHRKKRMPLTCMCVSRQRNLTDACGKTNLHASADATRRPTRTNRKSRLVMRECTEIRSVSVTALYQSELVITSSRGIVLPGIEVRFPVQNDPKGENTYYAKRCSKKNGSFEVKKHKYAGNARKASVIAPAARARAAFMAVY